jgi:hypothetical protein
MQTKSIVYFFWGWAAMDQANIGAEIVSCQV